MIYSMYTILDRFSSGKTLLIMLVLSFILMFVVNTINLPGTVPRINQISGGAGILDTKLTYNSVDVYQILDAQRAEGRTAYIKFLTTFDFIFPFVYSLALSVVITVLFRHLYPSTFLVKTLSLLPFLAGLFDYLENIAIIRMITMYPIHMDYIAFIAGCFTLGKWIASFSSIIVILIGVIRSLFYRRNT